LGSLGGIPQTIDILPPRCISVRSPVHGMLTFDGIAEDTTVGHLKVMIVERVGLSPARRIHLSWFGRELPDQLTLAQCRVRSSSVLDMRLTLVRLDAFERTSLERVRVLCTCLETQTYAVDRTTTAAELKLKIRSFLTRGEHEWFGKKGERSTACGTTVFVNAALKADEKAGTEAFGLGEELVTTAPLVGEGKGKPISVFRVRKGKPAMVGDSSVALLDLPPEKQRLSFRAQTIEDSQRLWDVGVRHDDVICLEFESPTMPQKLQLVRAPDKPKDKKKGGKKGGGKKKK